MRNADGHKSKKAAVAASVTGLLALTGPAPSSASGSEGEAADTISVNALLRPGGRQRAGLRGLRRPPTTARASSLRDVVRRVRRPEPRRRGRRRRRRRPLLPRDRRDPTGRRGPGRRGLEGQRDQRHRDLLGRGLRGPRGQPRRHPDLGRPGGAGRRDHHAQPRLVRVGAVEHPRGVGPRHRQRRQRGRGRGVRHQAAREHHRPARQRPRGDHGVHRRQRRRAAVLRERGDPGQAERRRDRLRPAARHAADREPGRRHRRRRRARPSRSSSS